MQIRLASLRHTFLPSDAEMDPTGNYTQHIYDRTTAYRLLAHAEFESFIEDIIKYTVKISLDKWSSHRVVSLPLVCISASYEGSDRINAFTDNKMKKFPLSINTYINKAYSHFEHNIGNNNGIRTKNLMSLLVQVGIEFDDLDATWVGAVDAFGAHRNVIGHNSGHIAYQADPKTALDAVNKIIEGLREVDEKLSHLRRNI